MSIEQTIQQEIEEYKVRHKLQDKPEWVVKDEFMNNFYGYFTDENSGYSHRALFKGDGWDTTSRNWLIENYGNRHSDDLHRNLQAYSELYLSQTGRQLMETIDQTVLEVGVDPEKLKTLATKMLQKLDGMQRREFVELMLFPVYLKLRERGYKHKELVR